MRWRALCPLLLAGVLTACGTQVERAPSSLLIPEEWRNQVGPAAAPEAQWWQAFGDPDLNRLVEQALRNNPDILIARSRVDEYRAQLRAVRGDNFPQLNAEANASRQRSLSPVTGQARESNTVNGLMQASYNVDLWGERSSSIDAARATLEARQAAASAADLTIASSVASGYLTLCALDEKLRVTIATLDSRENALRLAQHQYEAGYSSRLEWMQAASEYQAAKAQLPQIQQQITRQENALSTLAGMNPRQLARNTRFDQISPQTLPRVLPSQLLARRPDIVEAQRLLLAADDALASASARLLPSLNLSASGTLQRPTLHQLVSDPIRLWSIGGSILAPIFNREALTAQVDISMASRNQALYSYEKSVRNAFSEVNTDIDAIRRYQQQLEALEQQEDVVREALRIARNRYRNGYASYLEELDAQRTLFSTRLNVIQTKNDLLLAQIDLYRALGGGWQVVRSAP